MVAITSILLLAATVATTATASVLRRNATPVVNSINTQLVPQITILQNDIDGFPASGFNGSVQLDSDEDTLMTILDTATTLTQQAGPFSIVDSLEVITAMQPATTGIINYNLAQATKVADFESIGRAPFVLANLQILNIRWTEFTNELIAAAPLGAATALLAMQTAISTSYASSIAVYSVAV